LRACCDPPDFQPCFYCHRSTLHCTWCRRRHHSSEVLFLTCSLRYVSWG
jgi:hypothetical protein